MFFQDVTWCEPQQEANTDDQDEQVVKVAQHRNEVRYDVNRRRKVQNQPWWDGPYGQWDARLTRQGQGQTELVTHAQTDNSPDQRPLLRHVAILHRAS